MKLQDSIDLPTRFFPTIPLLFSGILLVVLPTLLLCTQARSEEETIWNNTIEQIKTVLENHNGSASIDLDEAIVERIQELSYPSHRILRSFTSLAGFQQNSLRNLLRLLEESRIPFVGVELFETFVQLDGTTLHQATQLLGMLDGAKLDSIRLWLDIARTPGISASDLLELVIQSAPLESSGGWTLKKCLQKVHPPAAPLKQVIAGLLRMNGGDQWIVESFCQLPGLTPAELLAGMDLIHNLDRGSGMAVATLFKNQHLQVNEALRWLEEFFSQPRTVRDKRILSLSPSQHQLLQKTYLSGARDTARNINRLHTITDDYGREIGIRRLRNMSEEELTDLVEKLDPPGKEHVLAELHTMLTNTKRERAIQLLKRATGETRHQSARELTSENIGLLLTRPNLLYTSSIIDILIPELMQRVESQFGGDLLRLLDRFKPSEGNQLILTLASFNRLRHFLLNAPGANRTTILTRALEIGFRNEQNLLLFSPTIEPLFRELQPVLRRHLWNILVQRVDQNRKRENTENAPLAEQLDLVLHYLSERYPDISPAPSGALAQTPSAALLQTLDKAPFRSWLADRRISTLSIFPTDDDGHASYKSYCMDLIRTGYRIADILPYARPSSAKSGTAISPTSTEIPRLAIQHPEHRPGTSCDHLFRLSWKHPVTVNWEKQGENSMTLVQSTAISRTGEQQQSLLEFFFEQNYEILAQRGHSYWRRSQLILPLRRIFCTGETDGPTEKEKHPTPLFSIGSCGGLSLYLEVQRLLVNRVVILATTGSGRLPINNRFNRIFPELVARNPGLRSWSEVLDLEEMRPVFDQAMVQDYLFPGTLVPFLFNNHYRNTTGHPTTSTP